MIALAQKVGTAPDRIAFELRTVLSETYGFALLAAERTPAGEKLVGFQTGMLLSHGTSARALEGGIPFTELFDGGATRLGPTETQLGRANADDGVDYLSVHYVFDGGLPEDLKNRSVADFKINFSNCFSGNRLRHIYYVARGLADTESWLTGPFEIVDDYARWSAENHVGEPDRPYLIQSDLGKAVRNKNYALVRFLSYHPPVLRFPPAAREVLRHAYLGWSDAHMVATWGTTLPALKSRWNRILDIADRKMPYLFGPAAGETGRDRQPLLAYLRSHPEELWPFEDRR